VQTLETTPRAETHCSSRGMAKVSGLGRTTIQQIWRAFGLQPRGTETFKLSTDPLLIEKVRDIVVLCVQPPTRAVVWRWIAPNRCCPCVRVTSNAARTTIDGPTPRRCSPP
jgi:hypothetical protein